MGREEILKNIKEVEPIKGRNSMGASESWYNEYFMISKCFKEEELQNMSEIELNNLIKLANFAAEVFY
jgi:hypothetical protein